LDRPPALQPTSHPCSPTEKRKDENITTLSTATPAPTDVGLNVDSKV